MSFNFEITGSQVDGDRDYQEDAFLITHLGDTNNGGAYLVIVADGMGGHAAGNVASNIAVQTFNKCVSSKYPCDNISQVLRQAVKEANAAITETIRETAALKGMGCTLVAALFEKDSMRWVSVGDSHLYLVRDEKLEHKNADHSYGGFLDKMAAEGNEMEPTSGYSRNMLLSALTGEEIADIDCPDEPFLLHDADRVIVSSDGLDTLSEGKIIQLCTQTDSAKACTDSLLDAVEAEQIPRQDNTTVVVVDVQSKSKLFKPAQPVSKPASQPAKNYGITENNVIQMKAATKRQRQLRTLRTKRKSSKLPLVLGLLILAGLGATAWYMKDELGLDAIGLGDAGLSVDSFTDQDDAQTADDVAADDAGELPATGTVEPEAPHEVVVFRDALPGVGSGPELTWLPAGKFKLGSFSVVEADEAPVTDIDIQRIAIGTREISNAEYGRFGAANGAPDQPVRRITWSEAVAYTEWLSRETGHTYRLPSEAEWEYAAKARTPGSYWWDSVGSTEGDAQKAVCIGCGGQTFEPNGPAAVGSLQANPFGLYDTAGNVMEWVADCYQGSYEGVPTDASPRIGPGTCELRVARGGSYKMVLKQLRSTKRFALKAAQRYDDVGFRVVREP